MSMAEAIANFGYAITKGEETLGVLSGTRDDANGSLNRARAVLDEMIQYVYAGYGDIDTSRKATLAGMYERAIEDIATLQARVDEEVGNIQATIAGMVEELGGAISAANASTGM